MSLSRLQNDEENRRRWDDEAELSKLRAVAELVRERIRAAHRDWAPELRNAIAELDDVRRSPHPIPETKEK